VVPVEFVGVVPEGGVVVIVPFDVVPGEIVPLVVVVPVVPIDPVAVPLELVVGVVCGVFGVGVVCGVVVVVLFVVPLGVVVQFVVTVAEHGVVVEVPVVEVPVVEVPVVDVPDCGVAVVCCPPGSGVVGAVVGEFIVPGAVLKPAAAPVVFC
jgi:hypothetical protein